MVSLKELIAQKVALERQIELTATQERNDAVAKVRALMAEYGLNVSDLATKASGKPKTGKGNKVAAKYRNTATGETWSGSRASAQVVEGRLGSGPQDRRLRALKKVIPWHAACAFAAQPCAPGVP